jgi:hypothetical protein
MIAAIDTRRCAVRALRSLFFCLAAAAGCFSDSGVKKSVYMTGRFFLILFTVLFLVAEVMDLAA